MPYVPDAALPLAVLLSIALVGGGMAFLYIRHKLRRIHVTVMRIEEAVNVHLPGLMIDQFQQEQYLELLKAEAGFMEPLPPLRGWAASPDFLLEIFRHARDARPLRILECSSGASTVVLARAMQLNGGGHVFSLEHKAEFGRRTQDELVRHGLEQWATVIDAPLELVPIKGREWTWYSVERIPEGAFDMVVVDGPPEDTGALARFPAGPLLIPRLAQGGAMFLDDAKRPDEQEMVRRWRAAHSKLHYHWRYCEKGCVSLGFGDEDD